MSHTTIEALLSPCASVRRESFMWERVEVIEEPRLREPMLLVSLSTSLPQYRALYSHGRELADFMLSKMDFHKFATIYSSALSPSVTISGEGTSRLVSDSFYSYSGERDIVLLAGDSSPSEEQYEFSSSVLRIAKRLGAREVFSVGARWAEQASLASDPEVLGFSTDVEGVKMLRSEGVTILADEPAPYFSSLVVGMATRFGMRGHKIVVNHGEPMPHPRSVAKMLTLLSRILKFDVDTSELLAKAEAMAKTLTAQPDPAAAPSKERRGVYE
jgi:proteasome assembly chaperone (PAC2) family protein